MNMKTERLYKNEEWLEKKYTEENLIPSQIGKIFGVSGNTIRYWLEKYNILIRSRGEAGLLFHKKKTGNIKHWDKEWLEKKYSKEELNATQISKECGVDRKTIDKWLKRHNIFTRSQSKTIHLRRANHCNLSRKAIEFLNGELLGDGCLTTTAKKNNLPSENSSVLFRYGSKYLEYCQYVSDTLKSFGIKQSGNIIKYYHKIQEVYSYKYNSHSYKELSFIYKKWYPKGIKIVPKDIELTPLTVRQWYIGDGSLIHQNGNIRIILCTCGFSILNVNRLIEKLNNLGFKAMRQPSLNTIHISTYSVKDFLNYIGKCPTKSYQYKWALERR